MKKTKQLTVHKSGRMHSYGLENEFVITILTMAFLVGMTVTVSLDYFIPSNLWLAHLQC